MCMLIIPPAFCRLVMFRMFEGEKCTKSIVSFATNSSNLYICLEIAINATLLVLSEVLLNSYVVWPVVSWNMYNNALSPSCPSSSSMRLPAAHYESYTQHQDLLDVPEVLL